MSWIAFIFSTILLLLSIIIGKFLKNKTPVNPALLFNILWTIILFLSALNLYNIAKPSDEAYSLISIMQAFFTFGCFLASIYKPKKKIFNKQEIKPTKSTSNKKDNPLTKIISKKINWKLLLIFILFALSIIFNMIDIILIIKYASQGTPAWQVRNWTLEPYGSHNPILDRRSFVETIFRNIILSTFAYVSTPITLYLLFKTKNKQRFVIFILSIIDLISTCLAGGGGRLSIITFVGCFILILFINRKDDNIQKIFKKYKKIFVASILLGIILIAIFTIMRTGFGNIAKQAYTYFALPPTLLSEWLPKIKSTPNTFGFLTFYGVLGYPLRALNMLGVQNIDLFAQATHSMLNAEEFINVGYGVANAFVSPIYYFMIDGGVIFTALASILFSFIITTKLKKINAKNNLKNTILICLIVYGILISFMRVQTVIPTYIIAFVVTELLFKKDIEYDESTE